MRIRACNSGTGEHRQSGVVGGFTLVELVVVILIIAILSVVTASKLRDISIDSKVTTTISQLDAITEAVELYRAENGSYPPSTNATNASTTLGPYLHASFFTKRLPIAAGQFSQYSKPSWTYYKYSNIERGYLYLPFIDPDVAAEIDSVYDDGVSNTGEVLYYDYSSFGLDSTLLYYYVVFN